MPNTDLWRWNATDLALAIRLRKVSSREAVEACLARIAAVNPRINAITETLEKEARIEAERADAAVKSGADLGPLHGVPVLIKENVDQKGLATVNGVEAFLGAIASEDSPPVANWRKAGAIVIGRTNTPAFSLRWETNNAPRGRTRNPWHADHTPGGSSGGAGAALATGMAPLAHGNDYGGSIRYPAYCCGVAGIRPTLGRVPAFNGTAGAERPPSAQLMSVQGPMARRVADVRIGLAAMAQRDERDPWWVPAPLAGPPAPRPIRVALVKNPGGEGVSAAVASAVEAAGRALDAAGYAVEEIEPPECVRIADMARKILGADIREVNMADILRLGDDDVRAALRYWLEVLPEIDYAGYRQVLTDRNDVLRKWLTFLEERPLIVGPVSTEPPFRFGFDTTSVQRTREVMTAQRFQYMINFLGLPSAAVSVGATKNAGVPDGLPLGVQVIASRYREDLALDAAEVIEAALGLETPIEPRS